MSQQKPSSQNTSIAEKFLKKGEGLKRFAAYKPPLPTIACRSLRRQTFVKSTPNNMVSKDRCTYDECIDLSKQIPKIAPPKIMHTPIRPNHGRPALGALKVVNSNLFGCLDSNSKLPPKRYNLRGTRKNTTETKEPSTDPEKKSSKGNRRPRAVSKTLQQDLPGTIRSPKKFLKKGEGLKRFAAYKPPLPTIACKSLRRQTFTKIEVDNVIKDCCYESFDLSKQIPKIAPPKIMHTPIRPNHGRLTSVDLNPYFFNCLDSNFKHPITTNDSRESPLHQNQPNQPRRSAADDDDISISKKPTLKTPSIISTKTQGKISLHSFKRPNTPPPIVDVDVKSQPFNLDTKDSATTEPKRYNLRGTRKNTTETKEPSTDPEKKSSKGNRRPRAVSKTSQQDQPSKGLDYDRNKILNQAE